MAPTITKIEDLQFENDAAAYCLIIHLILFPLFTVYLAKTMCDYKHLISP